MEQIRLEPVDAVRITTVIDNSSDLTLSSSLREGTTVRVRLAGSGK